LDPLQSYMVRTPGRLSSGQLSSARVAEKRWCYSWVDSWQEFCTGSCEDGTWAQEA
jgi:hypothetical protein